MAEFTTLNVLNGFTKDIYSGLKTLIPDSAKLYKELPFVTADKQGGKYKQTVITADESGFTHAASGDGAFSVNAGESLETEEAYVEGFQTVVQGSIDYESAARAASSKQAYKEIIGLKLENLFSSGKKRIDCELMYGQTGIGKVASAGTVSSGVVTLTITAGSHAPLIWGGKKNHRIVFYNGTTGVASGASFKILSSDVAHNVRTVKIAEIGAGDATTLKGVIDANPNVVDIYWASAAQGGTLTHKSCAGVMKIATATSGTLFNINLDNVDLCRGNTFSAGTAALSFVKCLDAAQVLVSRGYEGDLITEVHPKTWANLMTDQAALKRYGGKETDVAKVGFRGVEFEYQGGSLFIRSNGMMKGGLALMRPKQGLKRIGAQELSFEVPGQAKGAGDMIFWHDPTKAGYSYRLYSHQAVFSERLGQYLLQITDIVNS